MAMANMKKPDKPKRCFKCGGYNLIYNRCLDCLLEQCFEEIDEEEEEVKDTTRPLPKYPTTALPGTLEKLAIMQLRWERNEQLFHPLDATMSSEDYNDLGNFLEPDEPQRKPIFERKFIGVD
jgi:hypothetical protein